MNEMAFARLGPCAPHAAILRDRADALVQDEDEICLGDIL
jgi:hypothetical protein